MIDLAVLLAFVPAALALNLTPGADMMFCLGQGMRAGRRAAIAASAGISVGAMVHAAIAGAGLGAAVAALPWLFDLIRWVGVCYLLWLAWQAVLGSDHGPDGAPPIGTVRAFRTGLVVNLTNPKVILFILAFVPQFVDPDGPILAQFLIFGLILSLGGFFINAAVGAFAGRATQSLTGSDRARRVLGWISGGIFAALALRLAILEKA
ncbi:MAG: LysE family translocator [Pseudomonadota bacterium]